MLKIYLLDEKCSKTVPQVLNCLSYLLGAIKKINSIVLGPLRSVAFTKYETP
jgi:hypothetical protein